MESDTPYKSIKVALVGQCGVGKTSIILRFSDDNFKEQLHSTLGGSHVFKTVDFPEEEEQLKFAIWDTAGQERYHSMIKVFYRDAQAILIVYSITLRASFEAIKDYWYPEVMKVAPKDTIICIIANKIDLYLDEEVKDEEGEEYAKSIGALFCKTSAKTKTGIDQLFNDIGKTFIENSKNESTINQESHKLSNETKQKSKGCC